MAPYSWGKENLRVKEKTLFPTYHKPLITKNLRSKRSSVNYCIDLSCRRIRSSTATPNRIHIVSYLSECAYARHGATMYITFPEKNAHMYRLHATALD